MSFKEHFDVYEFDCILPGSGETIKFQPLNTRKIKKLLVHENTDDYREIEKILDKMIQLSVIDDDFDVESLYLQDRFFLLAEIRKKTKGETIEEEYKCPKCESQTLIVHNLDDMEVKKLNPDIDNKIVISSKVSVYMWYITVKQEREAIDASESTDINNPTTQFNIIAQGIQSIETPSGKEENLSFDDKVYIIDSMTINNLNQVKDWYENNYFGLNFMIEKKCKQCKNTEKASIPLRNFFF